MREAQGYGAGRLVRLVAQPVARLLGGGAVVAKPVGLHDQVETRPEEVHPESVDVLSGERRRQPGPSREWEEQPLEVGVGELEGLALKQAADAAHAGTLREAPESGSKRVGSDQVIRVRLVDHPREPARSEGAAPCRRSCRRRT